MTSKKNYELAKKLFKENEPYKHPIAIGLISGIIESEEKENITECIIAVIKALHDFEKSE